MSDETPKLQLQMAWDERLPDTSPQQITIPDGYLLRAYLPGDEQGWYRVMDLAGFEGWGDEQLEPWLSKILPGGWFMVIHEETGNIVATAMAVHGPTDAFPFGGELGWVAGDPEHSGKNLGMAVCSAVTSRLLDMGYRLIHLNTDELSVRNWTGRIPQRFGG